MEDIIGPGIPREERYEDEDEDVLMAPEAGCQPQPSSESQILDNSPPKSPVDERMSPHLQDTHNTPIEQAMEINNYQLAGEKISSHRNILLTTRDRKKRQFGLPWRLSSSCIRVRVRFH